MSAGRVPGPSRRIRARSARALFIGVLAVGGGIGIGVLPPALRAAEDAAGAGALGGTGVPSVNAATGFNVNEAIGFTLPAPGYVVSTPSVNAATGFNVNEATGFTLPAPGYVVAAAPNVNAATGFTLP